jgi:g-D-glutamyl-meso-diaminopimelate peptidase
VYSLISLQKDLNFFKERGDKIINIGSTVFGNLIPAIIVGQGLPNALIFGGIHAREHITSKLVSALAKAYKGSAIMFAPMINIDGIMLSLFGERTAPINKCQLLLDLNGGSHDFSLWKANGNGVDLNVNFNAGWGSGKQNITNPAPSNYIGKYPESEPETKALVKLCKEYTFKAAISYHAKGEVIYYGFENDDQHKQLSSLFSSVTGYPSEQSVGSAGGFKDWFVQEGGFGLTVEVGKDSQTYTGLYDDFSNILRQNLEVPKLIAEVANGYKIYGAGY